MLLARLSPRAAVALVSVSIALPLGACSQDHDALAPDPPTTSAASSSSSSSSGGEGGEGGSGGAAPVEPSGPTQLTIVNGVNDYDAVRLCFVPYPGGGAASPFPAGDKGIPFATGVVVDPITSVIPAATDVNTFVIAGNLTATSSKSCAEAIALAEGANPPVVVASLGVLPASAFTSDRSLLLATTGCLGGPGHTDESQALGCGASYTLDTPTAGLVALGMSRIKSPDAVSLQVAHASTALPTVDIRVRTGGQEQSERLVASKLTYGAAGPKPPFAKLSAAEYGSIDASQIITTAPNSAAPTSLTPLSSIFQKSSIKASDFKDGEGLVLVAVGGYPGSASAPWWHPLTYALVRADP